MPERPCSSGQDDVGSFAAGSAEFKTTGLKVRSSAGIVIVASATVEVVTVVGGSEVAVCPFHYLVGGMSYFGLVAAAEERLGEGIGPG